MHAVVSDNPEIQRLMENAKCGESWTEGRCSTEFAGFLFVSYYLQEEAKNEWRAACGESDRVSLALRIVRGPDMRPFLLALAALLWADLPAPQYARIWGEAGCNAHAAEVKQTLREFFTGPRLRQNVQEGEMPPIAALQLIKCMDVRSWDEELLAGCMVWCGMRNSTEGLAYFTSLCENCEQYGAVLDKIRELVLRPFQIKMADLPEVMLGHRVVCEDSNSGEDSSSDENQKSNEVEVKEPPKKKYRHITDCAI